MCGIAGKIYFDLNRKIELSDLKKMANAIYHRGPDDEGYFIDENAGLSFRRLSIIDLKTGHQPLSDNSGRYWITFNGEIYNFLEIREHLKKKRYFFKTNTDTEVIANLYAEYKERCLDFLRGMFAFVIWDKKEKRLFGARDRFGIKPFFYYLDSTKFIWGSEIKAIMAAKNVTLDINYESLDYYFTYGYSPRKYSIFEQIKKLEPANYFILSPFEKEKMIIRSYWEIDFDPDYSKTEAYWKEALYNLLNESVKMRMISDVPLGAFLSGGIDSSTVVSLMAMNSSEPIKTFSIGFKEEKYNELNYARKIAHKYHTEHHEMIVEPESIELLPKLVSAYDEPFADSSAIPTYYVSKFAKEYVTVVLSGDGGDELFAGYDKYLKILKLKNLIFNNKFFNKFIFKKLNSLLPDFFYGKGLTYYLSKNKNFLGAYFVLWKDYERKKIYNKDLKKILDGHSSEKEKLKLLNTNNIEFMSSMQRLDIHTYLVDDILTKVDRVSMLNSLEVRIPILDHKFAELSFKIPWDLKLKEDKNKYILKEAFKQILPNSILNHRKQGFAIPFTVWFKNDLKEYAFDTLLKSSKLDTYLDKNYILRILRNHQKGMRDYSAKVWSLLFLNEWLNQNQ